MCVQSCFSCVWLYETPWTVAHQAPLTTGCSPGKITGVGSLSLLQGIFPTQGSNPSLVHCRKTFHCLSYKGSPLPWVSCRISLNKHSKWNQSFLKKKNTLHHSPSQTRWNMVFGYKPRNLHPVGYLLHANHFPVQSDASRVSLCCVPWGLAHSERVGIDHGQMDGLTLAQVMGLPRQLSW